MMYAKLALENVKKSTKDYLIYIVTLTAASPKHVKPSTVVSHQRWPQRRAGATRLAAWLQS